MRLLERERASILPTPTHTKPKVRKCSSPMFKTANGSIRYIQPAWEGGDFWLHPSQVLYLWFFKFCWLQSDKVIRRFLCIFSIINYPQTKTTEKTNKNQQDFRDSQAKALVKHSQRARFCNRPADVLVSSLFGRVIWESFMMIHKHPIIILLLDLIVCGMLSNATLTAATILNS